MKLNDLTLAGWLSVMAGAAHFAIIVGGPDWYRFFGAGEVMAQMAEQGHLYPPILTALIGVLLIGWGLYAWSGAGSIRPLPLLRAILVLITSVYLLRGVAGLVVPLFSDHPQIAMRSSAFWLWSSVICTGVGIVHLIGVYRAWPRLAVRKPEAAST